MLNDREEKYDDNEESEYHFSEDEVSYEVEPETPKAATSEGRLSFLNKLSGSRRMVISLVVFLVLVFIVYKMVAPSSTQTPSTDIVPSAPPIAQATPPATTPLANQVPPAAMATAPTNAAENANMSASLQSIQNGIAQPQPTSQPTPMNTTVSQIPAQTVTVTTSETGAPMTGLQPPPPAQPMSPPAAIPAQQGQVAVTTGMPALMPVQSATPTLTQQVPAAPTQQPAPATSAVAVVAATGDKLIGQLQAEYTQRLTDYANQNKALQDQVQTLNARVASMENQMGQLIQALTRQNQPVSQPVVPVTQANDVKVAYNVQAIIPGRAWLRSDAGETVTVAEGDLVKDLGRITKIDPYDGVVEINTGTKVISLTYGTGES